MNSLNKSNSKYNQVLKTMTANRNMTERCQYSPIFSVLHNGEVLEHRIGVYDCEYDACHETIIWMIENEMGFDTESDAWERDFTREEAIEFLCGKISTFKELIRTARRLSTQDYEWKIFVEKIKVPKTKGEHFFGFSM